MIRAGCLLLLLAAVGQDAPRELPRIALDEFSSRREALAGRFRSGMIVCISRSPREGFRVEWPSNASMRKGLSFFYLVGRDYEGGRLLIEVRSGRTMLFCDGDPATLQKETGVDEVQPEGAFYDVIRKKARKLGRVYLDGQGGTAERLAEIGVSLDTRALQSPIYALRALKSPGEVRMLRVAATATARAQVAAIRASTSGINEGEIQEIIEKTMRLNGCNGLAFRSICGSSANTPVLHYRNNNRDIADGELILCDVGGSYRGYASDITRTWPINGTFSVQQRKRYEAVLAAQKAAEALLKPGVTWPELEKAARKAIARSGFRSVSYQDHHRLGHFVGLQTHDASTGGPLQAGMCITLEPGIYDRRRKISIRIEDTYLLTEDGFERISDSAPREVGEIEALMRRRGEEY